MSPQNSDLEGQQPLRVSNFEQVLGKPQAEWAHQCHAISHAIVRSGIYAHLNPRVARGTVPGVRSQHSWVVLGEDCYDAETEILDLTLWSYLPQAPVVYCGNRQTWMHTPHGSGNIFMTGMPQSHGGPAIKLTPEIPLDKRAINFLALLGPLDVRGWHTLAHLPVEGWPAKQIITAMYQTPSIRPLIPIDIVGMVTDLNPQGLYR